MKKIIYLSAFLFLINCDNKRDCTFENMDCGKSVYTDQMEGATIGTNNGFTGINGSASVTNFPNASNKAMSFIDGPGSSVVFRSNLFPSNLIKAGCDVYYKVALTGAASSDNSLIIHDSSYLISTTKANFRLYANTKIIGNGNFQTIKIPLQLASNGVLPSNEYGTWEITPMNNPTDDAQRFNQLIQNIGGIAFSLDVPNSPNAVWYYDDISIKTCCPNY